MSIKCPKCKTENPDTQNFCGECAAPLQSPKHGAVTETLETPFEELTTGSTFAARYQIIEELGKGGMGRVFKAHDQEINEKIALKLIKPEISSDRNTIERFRNELKVARRISHKNVCRMFDLNKDKGRYYITMEYVPGEDLKSMIQMTRQLTVGAAISIAKQICEGLTEAHKQGIVHRDLKPNNIMIDKAGNARIMDFGIARVVKGKAITGSGVMIGTPQYMSPEQVEGKDVDQRSDIYSLGIILYEMLTGRVPFDGDSHFTVGIKHKSEAPDPPVKINPRISEDLNRLILKCLEKEKEKRFQSAEELRSALEQIEQELPTTERTIPKGKPVTSREITVSFNIKKYLIPVFILFILVTAALLIWRPWGKKTSTPIVSDKPTLAVLYFENNTGDESLGYLRSGLSEWLITDLSQSKFLNVISGDRIYSTLKRLNLLETEKYSAEDLKKVGEGVFADHVLKGSYIKVGENFVITAMLQKPGTNETVSSIQARCRGAEEIPDKIDEVTRQIKLDLALSPKQIASDIDEKVEKITTSSPEAFRLYSEGREFHHALEYRKSIEKMEKAIEIDPQFAMAYRGMAVSFNNSLLFSEATKFHRKAFELRERLSDRERYLIEGEYYREKETTYPQAIKSYSQLLELYPDDTIGNTNLGIVYNSIEEWGKAIERLTVLIRSNDPSPFTVVNLTDSYGALGLYDKAQAALENYRDSIDERAVIQRELSSNYFFQGKHELALEECEKALTLNPSFLGSKILKGQIILSQGNLKTAEDIYLEVLESKELGWHLYTRLVLGALYFHRGRYPDSVDQFNLSVNLAKKLQDKWWEACGRMMIGFSHLKSGNAEKVFQEAEAIREAGMAQGSQSWQQRALALKALALIETKALTEAESAAEELKEFVQNGLNKKKIRYYYFLLGKIELEKDNFASAINHLERAKSLLAHEFSFGAFDCDHALFYEPLALAYLKAGRLEEAEQMYREIQSLNTGKVYFGDTYVLSFYWLGRIFEQQGDSVNSREHYEKFLSLWKNADAGIAEVEEAKKRLAGLDS